MVNRKAVKANDEQVIERADEMIRSASAYLIDISGMMRKAAQSASTISSTALQAGDKAKGDEYDFIAGKFAAYSVQAQKAVIAFNEIRDQK